MTLDIRHKLPVDRLFPQDYKVNPLRNSFQTFYGRYSDLITKYQKSVSERFILFIQSVSWILAEFYFSRGLQRLYTGTCIILQKTINGFLCLLIIFLKSKTYQLILKDVIKLNRNLR